MSEDPIVAETRKMREEMMAEAGNDLDALFQLLKKEKERYRDRLVRLPARKAVPSGAGRGRTDGAGAD